MREYKIHQEPVVITKEVLDKLVDNTYKILDDEQSYISANPFGDMDHNIDGQQEDHLDKSSNIAMVQNHQLMLDNLKIARNFV